LSRFGLKSAITATGCQSADAEQPRPRCQGVSRATLPPREGQGLRPAPARRRHPGTPHTRNFRGQARPASAARAIRRFARPTLQGGRRWQRWARWAQGRGHDDARVRRLRSVCSPATGKPPHAVV